THLEALSRVNNDNYTAFHAMSDPSEFHRVSWILLQKLKIDQDDSLRLCAWG
ncbi:MAG: hypothetical protein Q9187_009675, partial [Circinaria calcarea]